MAMSLAGVTARSAVPQEPEAGSWRLVVKHTFFELREPCPCGSRRGFGRACTDSQLGEKAAESAAEEELAALSEAETSEGSEAETAEGSEAGAGGSGAGDASPCWWPEAKEYSVAPLAPAAPRAPSALAKGRPGAPKTVTFALDEPAPTRQPSEATEATAAYTGCGSSCGSSCGSLPQREAQEAGQAGQLLVVRRTFLELAEDRPRSLRGLRSRTDSVLELADEDCADYCSPVATEGCDEALGAVPAAAPVAAPVAAAVEAVGQPVAPEASKGRRRRRGGKEAAAVAEGRQTAQGMAQGMAQAQGSAEPERTTLMLRNLPNNYTRDMIMEMLDAEGFKGQYDFLYLPMDFKTKAALGYAFVNLVEASLVQRFWATFEGYSKWTLPTAKEAHVSWSGPFQGLKAHLQRYRNSPIMHPSVPEHFKPVYLVNGCPARFPRPTRALQPPQARQ